MLELRSNGVTKHGGNEMLKVKLIGAVVALALVIYFGGKLARFVDEAAGTSKFQAGGSYVAAQK